ncbi:unnamed protein product [Alternaria alternata]
MGRKARRTGGSSISTAQVRVLSSCPPPVVERHTDAPTATLAQIRQFYGRHAPLCDGEKFLHIRFFERQKDYAVASRWTRLLGAKAKTLRQVVRSEWLRDCLEKLEPFRALWEVEYYLSQVYEIWHAITGGDAHLCDEYTVEKLGGLAPLWSSRDRSTIETWFATRQIFPRARDPGVGDSRPSHQLWHGSVHLRKDATRALTKPLAERLWHSTDMQVLRA